MTATVDQARDEILGALKTAWEGDSTSADLPILWPDRSQEPPKTGAWARAHVQHTEGETASLSGETGNRRFRNYGIVTVQIFTPTGMGLTLADQLVKIAVRAFQGVTTTSGVIFRNARPREVGQSGNWFQTNVLANFEYDEVR